MQNNVNTNVERIIAKIDNDFNPDNSDWIPRVGAWCIDAMSQLDILRTTRKRKKLIVKDRIAYSDCPLDNTNIKVYDNNGCEIKKADNNINCCNVPSTGESPSETRRINCEITPDTIDVINTGHKHHIRTHINTVNDKYPFRYNVVHETINPNINNTHDYVIVDCNKIEINFDTNYIFIETEYIETIYSETYGCELPVIPNNGLLIEAIVYYCMYKMLCRGYKHPVFNLNASQYGTNPYYIWTQLKSQARSSVISNIIDNDDTISKLFRSNFFINTFDTRN